MMGVKVTREHVEAGVSVILRLPALFILEAWYRSDPDKDIPKTTKDVEIIAGAVYYTAVLLAVVLATLPLKKLVMFYMYLVSLGLLTAAYQLSQMYVTVEKSQLDKGDNLLSVLENYEASKRLVLHLFAQCIIAAVIAYLIDAQSWTKYAMLIFTAPMIAKISGLPSRDLPAVHNFSTIFSTVMILFYIFNNLGYAIDIVKEGFSQAREAARVFGWLPVFVTFWHTIMLPVQLVLFWIVLFVVQIYVLMNSKNHPILKEGSLIVLLASLGECCATPISLFALCTTIAYSSYYVLTLTKVFLLGREGLIQDNDLLRGWTEGFTMLLIAVQTGLLDLKPIQRAFLMSILLFIVVSSMIQSMYEITEPILLGLSAAHSKNKWKNIRAVLLCTFLWMFPLYMSFLICQYFDLDFWLMIIISSCLLTSVQVIGALLVYWLFMYDAMRVEPWEKLDDVVYYTRSIVRVLEFVVAVCVVCYGIKESIFGEWSWTNSLILLIHCYFNVWQRLQSGWKTFLLRREAVKKLESLPEATEEQLVSHNDVCAICFQELKTARVTKCEHFFHGCCLKKWLYVKDSCPMCHQPINETSPVLHDQGETTASTVHIDDIVEGGEFSDNSIVSSEEDRSDDCGDDDDETDSSEILVIDDPDEMKS